MWKILIVLGTTVFLLSTAGLIYLLIENIEINQLPLIGQKVAVIPIKGTITLGGCGGSVFGATQCASVGTIKEMLKNADEDGSVRAIVLDINSGGGHVVASRELERAIRDTQKPTVACIREVGASGAYYAASAADHIVADRNSMTGSIGVVMTIQQYYGLFEKLGINVTVIKSGAGKDTGSPYREMTDEERRELKEMIDKIHYDFVFDVARNRNLSFNYVYNISDGSIYLGSDAKEMGLIDSFGHLEDAIDIASDMGKIGGKPVISKVKPKRVTLWDMFSTSSKSGGAGDIGSEILKLIHIYQNSNN